MIFRIFQPNKDFLLDHLPATVYESGQYDDSKLKDSWPFLVLVRYHQSQKVQIFDKGKNTTIYYFQSWVTTPEKASLLQIDLRNDLKTLVKWPFFPLTR